MATIKHIYKGESLSILFAFPAEYDMARIQSHGIWIGGTEFTGVIIGQGIELKLTSLQTDLMSGNQRVSLWIDDSQLGVRKPYVGDIAVGNTNALPDNESTSEVYDVIVNVDISVTSIEAGDLMFNYVKGDPLTYDDLTPEQIAELQQPATDAIASIQEVELAVETAEGLRVQAELNRQANTSTAISNAEQATDDANNAALLANEKANLANEKAGLAATATTQANAARDGANSAAQLATNLVDSYAADLAAKELKDNKQNSLAVDGTGTKFPTVDAVNEGLVAKANVEQEAWITPTLLNGWTGTVQYRKDNFGVVHFRGVATGGNDNTVVFKISNTHRCLRTQINTVNANGLFGTGTVRFDMTGSYWGIGTVSVLGSSLTRVEFGGLSYSTFE